jgi:hypothetical protein
MESNLDQSELCKELLASLKTGSDISEVFERVKQYSTNDVQHIACDIVPEICKTLDGESDSLAINSVTTSAEKVLNHLVDACEPKEFLVLLVEQAREQWTGTKFLTILPVVRRCIDRIAAPRQSQSLAFVLSAFSGYLDTLSVPSMPQLELKERMLLDCDESVRRICSVVTAFLNFVEPFVVQQVSDSYSAEAAAVGNQKVTAELSLSLLKALDHPLGRLDLTVIGQNKSEARVCAEKCVKLLAQLHCNFVLLTLSKCAKSEPDTENNTADGGVVKPKLDTFTYLAFGERIVPDCLPCVYSQQFLLELCAPSVSSLLDDAELSANLHGLHLCSRLLRNIEPDTLPIDVLENDDLRQLVMSVMKCATAAKTKELNSGLLRALSAVSRSLEPAARSQFIYLMLKIAPRSGGVIGHIIAITTDEIISNLTHISDHGQNFFAGSDLKRLLHLVFALPNGEKTDLLDNSERIMAALKLLGIVLERDTITNNKSGIWDLVPMIESKYLQLLRAGIDLSRSHYQLEIRKTKERGRDDPAAGRGYVVSGEAMNLPKRQQLGVLEMAVHTFDMMESVVVQISREIEKQRKEGVIVV